MLAGLEAVCRGLALAGGFVLIGLALMTVASVLGRYFFNTPLTGDFEIVEMGCAVAVATFLPYCQLRRGHVIVDVLTAGLPAAVKRPLDAIGCLAVAAVAALYTWRLTLGGLDQARYNDETMVLQMPTWWGFAVLVPCLGLLALVAVVTAGQALRGVHAELRAEDLG